MIPRTFIVIPSEAEESQAADGSHNANNATISRIETRLLRDSPASTQGFESSLYVRNDSREDGNTHNIV